VLFVGSSSIRLWKLEKHFPGLAAINRGFGGSRIADSVDYAHRIITPYRPRQIVFYAGDNDVAEGLASQQIFVDFQILVGRIRTVLPEVPIIFIAIKPSIARWTQFDQQSQTNAMVQEYCNRDPSLHFLDIVNPMLRQGKPRPELFVQDGLHLSEEGYRLWSRILRPLLLPERPFDPRHLD
jgi:lysophospholipase L1-like esterase